MIYAAIHTFHLLIPFCSFHARLKVYPRYMVTFWGFLSIVPSLCKNMTFYQWVRTLSSQYFIQSVNMLSTGLQMLSKLSFKASFKKYER